MMKAVRMCLTFFNWWSGSLESGLLQLVAVDIELLWLVLFCYQNIYVIDVVIVAEGTERDGVDTGTKGYDRQ